MAFSASTLAQTQTETLTKEWKETLSVTVSNKNINAGSFNVELALTGSNPNPVISDTTITGTGNITLENQTKGSALFTGTNILKGNFVTVKAKTVAITGYGINTIEANDILIESDIDAVQAQEDGHGKVSLTAHNTLTLRGGTGGYAIQNASPDCNIELNAKKIVLESDGRTAVKQMGDASTVLEADVVEINGFKKGYDSKNDAVWVEKGTLQITAKESISITNNLRPNGSQGMTTAIGIDGGKLVINAPKSTVEGDIEADQGTLSIDGEMTFTGINATIADLQGKNATFVATDAKQTISIANNNENLTLAASGTLNDALNGNMSALVGTDSIFSLTSGAEKADVLMKEGLVAGEKTAQLNKDGTIDKSTITEKTNSVMDSTLQMASYMPMAMTRILTNDVRKRMGDLRAAEGKFGAWARYDGGKFSGERGFDTDFHTIQVGVDTVPTPDSARFGIAFSYTDGESEYVRTKSDMSAFSLAGYATWMAENGLFVDGVLRMAKVTNDVTVDGNLKGTMDNVVLSASAETGWRFDLNEMFYVEPQAEVMYTYVDGDKFDIGAAQYEIDAADSFTGRLGFASGIKCPNNKGDLYVRASVVHEFLGDSRVTGFAQGSSGILELDGKDTWVEYGFGGNFNLTKNTYLWADVERTSGSTLDTDYRATVGVRHAF